jgi:hypothetical protein
MMLFRLGSVIVAVVVWLLNGVPLTYVAAPAFPEAAGAAPDALSDPAGVAAAAGFAVEEQPAIGAAAAKMNVNTLASFFIRRPFRCP